MQIGQSPILSAPLPFTNRALYKSNALRGALYSPPGWLTPNSAHGDLIDA
jgi:hypothetical protein